MTLLVAGVAHSRKLSCIFHFTLTRGRCAQAAATLRRQTLAAWSASAGRRICDGPGEGSSCTPHPTSP